LAKATALGGPASGSDGVRDGFDVGRATGLEGGGAGAGAGAASKNEKSADAQGSVIIAPLDVAVGSD